VLGDHVSGGSPTTMAFAVAAFRDAQASREMLREQINRIADQRDEFQGKYYTESTKAAVLEATQKQSTRFKRFQSWAFGIGGVLAGAGLGSAVQIGQLRWSEGLIFLAGIVVMWIGSPINQSES